MTLASDAIRILRAGIRSADPACAVRGLLARRHGRILVGRSLLRPSPGGEVRVIALGKAAGAMIDAAFAVLGRDTTGLAVLPVGYRPPRSHVRVAVGEHPVPGRASLRAGVRLLEYVRSTPPADALLFLISGGGSACAELPAAGLSIREIADTTEWLLTAGVPIGEANTVRRHLSRIKGGGLALAAPARTIVTIALSDVVGDRPHDIASGPTVPDPSTFPEALDIVRRYGRGHRPPSGVRRHLEDGVAGRVPDTPKPGDSRWRHARFYLAATNRTALSASAAEARGLGYRTVVVRRPVTGPTRPAGTGFAKRLLGLPAGPRPAALLAGGETTVALGGVHGRGGRNQEFALAAAVSLSGADAVILSAGTDGLDGPTDAAGAWVDGRSCERLVEAGVDLEETLRRHDAYAALDRLGTLWKPGPTGTNVTDLHVGLRRSMKIRVRSDTGGNSRPGAVRASPRRPT